MRLRGVKQHAQGHTERVVEPRWTASRAQALSHFPDPPSHFQLNDTNDMEIRLHSEPRDSVSFWLYSSKSKQDKIKVVNHFKEPENV